MDQSDELGSKELFDLFQAARLASLYKEGLLSETEREALGRWLEASDEHRRWFEALLANEEDFTPKFQVYKELQADSQAAFQEICVKLEIAPEMEGRKTVRRRALTIGVAASVVLLLAGLSIYLYAPKQKATPVIAAIVADIPPGTNKATLVLSNGQTVVLDSAHAGVIAQQPGDATVLNKAGQLSYAVNKDNEGGEMLFNTITTGKGGQYKLVLSDGTKVWLDATSSLHYPTAFAGQRREVTLVGQAYFEVAHHSQPFIVHTGSVDVQDLGTAFNVNAYPEGKAIKATLIEGSIRVASGTRQETLVPGEQARVMSDGSLRIAKDVSTSSAIGWKEGLFVFDHTSLEEGMRQIARWYDVSVEYPQGKVPDREMLGTASLHENLSVLVKLLNYSGISCSLDLAHRKIIVQ